MLQLVRWIGSNSDESSLSRSLEDRWGEFDDMELDMDIGMGDKDKEDVGVIMLVLVLVIVLVLVLIVNEETLPSDSHVLKSLSYFVRLSFRMLF